MNRLGKEIHKKCVLLKELARDYLEGHSMAAPKERAGKFRSMGKLQADVVRMKKIHQAARNGFSGLKW